MAKFTKKPHEIDLIRENGKIIGAILQRAADMVKPGISTGEINAYAESEIKKAGGVPSFLGYGPKRNPFPAGLCTSINDVVVHGIPSEYDVLLEGDIVTLDIGMEYKGFFTDTAVTVPVGKVSTTAQKIIDVTRNSLKEALKAARPGNRIGDIGYATQSTAEKSGFSVVRDLVGHGVGYDVHEDPAVPCYGKRGTGIELVSGMVLAIEPMVCEGSHKIYFDDDGWTIRTVDGGLSAHFEHTVVITDTGVEILT